MFIPALVRPVLADAKRNAVLTDAPAGTVYRPSHNNAEVYAGRVGAASDEWLWAHAQRDKEADKQTDEHQTDALRLPLLTASVINSVK